MLHHGGVGGGVWGPRRRLKDCLFAWIACLRIDWPSNKSAVGYAGIIVVPFVASSHGFVQAAMVRDLALVHLLKNRWHGGNDCFAFDQAKRLCSFPMAKIPGGSNVKDHWQSTSVLEGPCCRGATSIHRSFDHHPLGKPPSAGPCGLTVPHARS